MGFAIRVSTAFLVMFASLLGLLNPAIAYYVQIQESHNAWTFRPFPPQGFDTGQKSQTESLSLQRDATATCTPGVNCPSFIIAANAQVSVGATAAPGTLFGVISGNANESAPAPFGPSHYDGSATSTWEDTVTITQTGDFRVTVTFDSSVSASFPSQWICGDSRIGASASLTLTGPVSFSAVDTNCTHPTTRTFTGTFHGLAGQTFTFRNSLSLNVTGTADLAFVGGSTSISVGSSAAVPQAGAVFKLDPATPGAAYTTESGVIYGSVIPNQPPIAKAGDSQSVPLGSTANLDGSASADPDGNPITFAWSIVSKPSGSSATLSDASKSNPSVTFDKPGDYVFSLVVTDSLGAVSAPDRVTISTANSKPIADAGVDQAVIALGSTIQLNGSQSYDPDGDAFTYSWSLSQIPNGSAATLSSTSDKTPTFTADVQGTYIATLVVMDSKNGFSEPDFVTISFTNVKPLANGGGNQAGSVGQVIQLNGSRSSDANGDRLTYDWTFVSKPLSSVAAMSSPSNAVTQFTADRAGTYIISLIVNDGLIDSDPDTLTVTITTRQDQVIQSLRQAIANINALNVAVFKNRNMRDTLTNKINAVLQNIDQGLYQQALSQLRDDVLGKTGGCAVAGVPDKNDWITDCGAQSQVSAPVKQAISILQTM